jgi:hypothetical protein
MLTSLASEGVGICLISGATAPSTRSSSTDVLAFDGDAASSQVRLDAANTAAAQTLRRQLSFLRFKP